MRVKFIAGVAEHIKDEWKNAGLDHGSDRKTAANAERWFGGELQRIHKRRFRLSVPIPLDRSDRLVFVFFATGIAAIDTREALGAAGLFEEVLLGKTLVSFQQKLLLRSGGVMQAELLLRGRAGMGGGEELLLRGGVALNEQMLLGGDGGLLEESCPVGAARGPGRFGGLGRGRHRAGAGGEADEEGTAEEQDEKRMSRHAGR